MTTNFDRKLVADLLRKVADEEIKPRFRNLSDDDVAQKTSDQDLVTIADIESERRLSEELPNILPGSVCLGEEAFAKDPSVFNHLSADAPVWVIDPVDGTYNFRHGNENFGILLALYHKGAVIDAWLYQVAVDDMFIASKGKGVRREWNSGESSEQVQAPSSYTGDLLTARGLTGGELSPHHALGRPETLAMHAILNEKTKGQDCLRCALMHHLALVRGERDYSLFGKELGNCWDFMAGVLLAEEAGYIVRHIDGSPYDPVNRDYLLLATNENLWDEVAELARATLY